MHAEHTRVLRDAPLERVRQPLRRLGQVTAIGAQESFDVGPGAPTTNGFVRVEDRLNRAREGVDVVLVQDGHRPAVKIALRRLVVHLHDACTRAAPRRSVAPRLEKSSREVVGFVSSFVFPPTSERPRGFPSTLRARCREVGISDRSSDPRTCLPLVAQGAPCPALLT